MVRGLAHWRRPPGSHCCYSLPPERRCLPNPFWFFSGRRAFVVTIVYFLTHLNVASRQRFLCIVTLFYILMCLSSSLPVLLFMYTCVYEYFDVCVCGYYFSCMSRLFFLYISHLCSECVSPSLSMYIYLCTFVCLHMCLCLFLLLFAFLIFLSVYVCPCVFLSVLSLVADCFCVSTYSYAFLFCFFMPVSVCFISVHQYPFGLLFLCNVCTSLSVSCAFCQHVILFLGVLYMCTCACQIVFHPCSSMCFTIYVFLFFYVPFFFLSLHLCVYGNPPP